MEQERIFTLIARKISGAASTEDLNELDQMVIDIPELGTYLETLEQDDTEKVEQAYQQMTDALDKQNLLYFIKMSKEEPEPEMDQDSNASNNPQHESGFVRFIRDLKRKLHKAGF